MISTKARRQFKSEMAAALAEAAKLVGPEPMMDGRKFIKEVTQLDGPSFLIKLKQETGGPYYFRVSIHEEY